MSYPLSIGSHQNESKRASYLKIHQSFCNTPSLIQRNSERVAQPQKHTVYNLFTTSRLLYLPFHRTIERIKSQTYSHFLWDFARVSMRINLKMPSLNSHENGVLAGCLFKNSNYVYNPPYLYKRSFFSEKYVVKFKYSKYIYIHPSHLIAA